MRLIDSFGDQEKAALVHALLVEAEIDSSVSSTEDASGVAKYHVWVVNEDDVDKALGIYEAFNKSPEQFLHQHKMRQEEVDHEPLIKGPIKVGETSPFVVVHKMAPLTRWVVIICTLLFVWNGYQKAMLAKDGSVLLQYFGITPLIMQMMYDVPVVLEEAGHFFVAHPDLKIQEIDSWPPELQQEFTKINTTPYWKGFYDRLFQRVQEQIHIPLFTKIAQGEVWRLLTPALLHANFLHILFNMLWLWMLGKEVESKIGVLRYLALMIVAGVVCNTAQYLMSGPFFMGYSGVICALGGFIWVRQRTAPWDGYAIPQGTLLFLFIFIVGMMVLQLVAFIVARMALGEFALGSIGNTAHVIGVLCGMLFARIPLFYRLRS